MLCFYIYILIGDKVEISIIYEYYINHKIYIRYVSIIYIYIYWWFILGLPIIPTDEVISEGWLAQPPDGMNGWNLERLMRFPTTGSVILKEKVAISLWLSLSCLMVIYLSKLLERTSAMAIVILKKVEYMEMSKTTHQNGNMFFFFFFRNSIFCLLRASS